MAFIIVNFSNEKINGIHLSSSQLLLITKTIIAQENCSLLIFGQGNDSLYWHHINNQGSTLFLEDNNFWLEKVTARNREIKAININYNTKRKQWRYLLENPKLLEINLPADITKKKWDIILVDAPAGYADVTPGRMISIYISHKLVKSGKHIFVHDCNREVEDIYSLKFLGKENLKQEIRASIGYLRHFIIPF